MSVTQSEGCIGQTEQRTFERNTDSLRADGVTPLLQVKLLTADDVRRSPALMCSYQLEEHLIRQRAAG